MYKIARTSVRLYEINRPEKLPERIYAGFREIFHVVRKSLYLLKFTPYRIPSRKMRFLAVFSTKI